MLRSRVLTRVGDAARPRNERCSTASLVLEKLPRRHTRGEPSLADATTVAITDDRIASQWTCTDFHMLRRLYGPVKRYLGRVTALLGGRLSG